MFYEWRYKHLLMLYKCSTGNSFINWMKQCFVLFVFLHILHVRWSFELAKTPTETRSDWPIGKHRTVGGTTTRYRTSRYNNSTTADQRDGSSTLVRANDWSVLWNDGGVKATHGPDLQHELRKTKLHNPMLTDKNTCWESALSKCSLKPVQHVMLCRKLYMLKVGV